MSSDRKLVVGGGAVLERAVEAWREALPGVLVQPVPIVQSASHTFDLSVLDGLACDAASAFVAWNQQFLNLRRFELVGLLKARGLPMPAFVHRSAVVAGSAQVGENCWIGAGVLVGEGTLLGLNCVVGAGANLGAGSQIGHSCWIAAGVQLGEGVRLGSHVTLGQGVLVGEGVEIGQFCIVDRPGLRGVNVAARTFIQPGFDEPIETVG